MSGMKLALSLLLILAGACRSADEPPPTDTPDAPVTADDPDAALPVFPDAPPGQDFCNATDPRTVPVVVQPTPEAGEAPYVEVLAAATTSIDVSVYMMGYGGILDQLTAKAAAGIPVRVILDEYKRDTNQRYFDMLVAAGAEVHWSDPAFDYFHAKYFVVDGAVAVISTGNYSKNYSIELERNFVVTDRDPADVDDLVRLFAADWAGAAPAVPCTRMVVSPINARARITALIASAEHTLDIESMQIGRAHV